MIKLLLKLVLLGVAYVLIVMIIIVIILVIVFIYNLLINLQYNRAVVCKVLRCQTSACLKFLIRLFQKCIFLFKKCILFFKKLLKLYHNGIGFRLGTFFERVLHSNEFFLWWYLLLAVMASVAAAATILLLRRIFFVFEKFNNNNNPKPEEEANMDLLLFFICIATVFPFLLVSKKILVYSLSFFQKVLRQMMKNRMGAGLLCGFIGAAKLGYFYYLLLVPRLFFDNYEDSFFFEHHQKRVAVIVSFLIGQSFHFLYLSKKRLFESLYKGNVILGIFLTFFVFQVVWTHATIVKNFKYLYPNDKRKKVIKRILFLQLEFFANFFLQLLPSDLDFEIQKPNSNSTVYILLKKYVEDKVFVVMTLLGWFLGHTILIAVFLKIFQLVMIWVYPHIQKIFEGGSDSDSDRKRGGWDFFRHD